MPGPHSKPSVPLPLASRTAVSANDAGLLPAETRGRGFDRELRRAHIRARRQRLVEQRRRDGAHRHAASRRARVGVSAASSARPRRARNSLARSSGVEARAFDVLPCARGVDGSGARFELADVAGAGTASPSARRPRSRSVERAFGQPDAVLRQRVFRVGELDVGDQRQAVLLEPAGDALGRERGGADPARTLPEHLDRGIAASPRTASGRAETAATAPGSAAALPRPDRLGRTRGSASCTWKSGLFQSAMATASSWVSPSAMFTPGGRTVPLASTGRAGTPVRRTMSSGVAISTLGAQPVVARRSRDCGEQS